MSNELLPCPFCGDDEIMDFQAHLENRVQCAMCNVSTDTFPSCEESHAAWNTRTKAAPTEVPYALRQWAMEDEPESTLFDEGYNAARRWVKMQLEYAVSKAPQPVSDDARDAARYRWLRCRTTTERIDLISHVYDTDMDNHIDAAMGSKGK